MATDGDSVDAHFDDRVIVASRLSHVAKVEDVGFFDAEFFEETGHAEGFVHTWGNGVDGGGAGDFKLEAWGKFVGTFGDGVAFFVLGVPGVFFFGAGSLAEGREGDLRETIFDNFVTVFQGVGFPVAKFFCGSFEGVGDFGDCRGVERVAIDLSPVVFFRVEFVVLGALGDEEMKMGELFGAGAGGF